MKYTVSKDGVERVTVLVPMRFERAEIEGIKKALRKDGRRYDDAAVRAAIFEDCEWFPRRIVREELGADYE